MADAWTLLASGSTVSSGDAWTRLQNLGAGEGTILVESLRSELEYKEPEIEVMVDSYIVEILSEEMHEAAVADIEIEDSEVEVEHILEPEIELEW
jgi:hypothetical protein